MHVWSKWIEALALHYYLDWPLHQFESAGVSSSQSRSHQLICQARTQFPECMCFASPRDYLGSRDMLKASLKTTKSSTRTSTMTTTTTTTTTRATAATHSQQIKKNGSFIKFSVMFLLSFLSDTCAMSSRLPHSHFVHGEIVVGLLLRLSD